MWSDKSGLAVARHVYTDISVSATSLVIGRWHVPTRIKPMVLKIGVEGVTERSHPSETHRANSLFK